MRQLWAIPIASSVVSLGLFAWAWVRKVDPLAGPALAWFGFALLEYGIESRMLCDEECNIRIDLILLPVLVIWTLVRVFKHVGEETDPT